MVLTYQYTRGAKYFWEGFHCIQNRPLQASDYSEVTEGKINEDVSFENENGAF